MQHYLHLLYTLFHRSHLLPSGSYRSPSKETNPSAINIAMTNIRPLNISVDEEALHVDVDAGVQVRLDREEVLVTNNCNGLYRDRYV